MSPTILVPTNIGFEVFQVVRTSNFIFVCVIVILVWILAQNLGHIPTLVSHTKVIYLPSLPASAIGFSPSEIQTWTNIKNRLEIYNSDPAFQGDKVLQWISMRNSTSAPWDNYNQKSMEWLCFWSGQGNTRINNEIQSSLSRKRITVSLQYVC